MRNAAAPAHCDGPAPGRLEGARVLVVGAAGGIGAVLVEALTAHGATVAAADLDGAPIPRVAAETVAIDVTSAASVGRATSQAAEAIGGLDVLVNCAGINHRDPFLDVDEADLDRILAVNLKGAFLVAQSAARHMVAAGVAGRILNVASISELRPYPGMIPYLASKAGIAALTRGMALELAGHGIRVNAIAPGLIETPMTAESLSDVVTREDRLSRIALGRIGTPRDLIGAALLLTSDESAWITGTVLVVDGGQLLT